MKKITLLFLLAFAYANAQVETSVSVDYSGVNSVAENGTLGFNSNPGSFTLTVDNFYRNVADFPMPPSNANPTFVFVSIRDVQGGGNVELGSWNYQSDSPEVTSSTDNMDGTKDVVLTITNIPSFTAPANAELVLQYNYFGRPAGFSNSNGVSGILALDNTLSSNDFSVSKLSAIYSNTKQSVIMNDNLGEKFAIYNLLGQPVLKGSITNEINVSSLKKGLYILSTENGSLKFVK